MKRFVALTILFFARVPVLGSGIAFALALLFRVRCGKCDKRFGDVTPYKGWRVVTFASHSLIDSRKVTSTKVLCPNCRGTVRSKIDPLAKRVSSEDHTWN